MIRVNLFLKKFDNQTNESTRISLDSKEFPKPNSYEDFISKISKVFNIKKKDIILNAFTTDEDEILIQDQQDLDDNKEETVEYIIILEKEESLLRKPTKIEAEKKEPIGNEGEEKGPIKNDEGEEDNKLDESSDEEEGGEDIKIKLELNLDIPDKEIENIINKEVKDIPPIDKEIINDDIPFNIDEYKEEMNKKYENIKNDFNKAFDSKIEEIVLHKSALLKSKIDDTILEFSKVSFDNFKNINNEAFGLKEDSMSLVENTENMGKAIEELSFMINKASKEKPKPNPEPIIHDSDDEDKITIKFTNKELALEIKKEKAKFLEIPNIEIENVGNESYKKLYFVIDENNSSKDICFFENSEIVNIHQLSLDGEFSPSDKGKHQINLQIKEAKPNQTYSLIIYVRKDPKKKNISTSFRINVKIKGEEIDHQRIKEENAKLLYNDFESKYNLSLIGTQEDLVKMILELNNKKNVIEEYIKQKFEEKDNNFYEELNMRDICELKDAKAIFKEFEYDKEKIKKWINERKEEKIQLKLKAEEKYNELKDSLKITDKISKEELIKTIIEFNFEEEKINKWIKEKNPQNQEGEDEWELLGEDPRLKELITKFDIEYNILGILDEDEFKENIIRLNYDESKIREYIDEKLNE